MSQDNRLMPLPPGAAPIDRPLRELTHPDRPNNTYSVAEPTHLRDYLLIVLKRKWLILSLVVVVTSLAAIQMYRQPSVYQSETTIQLEQRSKNLIKTNQLVINSAPDPTFWPTQLKLLENPRLARKVILALGLHNNPTFVGQERAGLLTALRRVVSSQPAKQEAKADGEGGLAVVNDAAAAAPAGGDRAAEPAALTPQQEARMEGLENLFRSRLQIVPVERTNLIQIRFEHHDPALAMRVTDEVAKIFIRENVERETYGSEEMKNQLGKNIVDLQNQINELQAQELAAKQRSGIPLSQAPSENIAASRLQTLGQQTMEAEAKLSALQSEWEAAQSSMKQPDGIFAVPVVQQDKYIQEAQTKLQEIEQQRAALLVTYTERYPAVVKLDEQRANLGRSMRRRAEDAVAALRTRYEAEQKNVAKLRGDYARARGEVAQQGIAATNLTNLQQRLETAKQSYNTYLAKQQEMALAPSELATNISISTPARTPALIGPPRVRNILIALLLSLAAGIGLAFLLDYLDDTLKSIEDVDRHVHLPTLALIPAPRAERKLLARGAAAPPSEAATALALVEDVRSPVTEAYRHLRTSLLLSSAGQPPRTVLVTSSQPSEGKTTTAVNTALMLAQTGAEVCLIDCDLRRPRIHGHFQMPNARGVTNYLSGELDVDKLVQPYDKLPNLKVVTSGPVPPNAAELLGSEQMRRLLARLSDQYQHVIIDSPPAISFTDASILSTMVDGVMLVVHGGRSSRAVVRRAKQQLMDVGAHIFGIVLNNVKPEGSNSYYYYYSSYYSGYYGEEEDGGAAGEATAAGRPAARCVFPARRGGSLRTRRAPPATEQAGRAAGGARPELCPGKPARPRRRRTLPLSKKALITGITGQDGSYLAEHLLSLGYEVHGLVRRVALEDPSRRFARISHLLDRVTLHPASLESYASIFHVFSRHDFDECYHLAAQSFVAESFADGFSTMNTNISGTHHVLAALRELRPACRFYFAGSSEMFGKVAETPQSEGTRFHPRSPYGISKVAGFELTRNYREAYGMFCVSGILFNHEGPRRGHEFVTRKISSAVARIKLGRERELRLGNLEARRDWGHAKDYVRAMHLMLQQAEPDDYVVATGETHTVREFCERAFAEVGLDYREHVVIDEQFLRPAEVDLLVGDSSKARRELGWEPTYGFGGLIAEMVASDLEAARRGGAG